MIACTRRCTSCIGVSDSAATCTPVVLPSNTQASREQSALLRFPMPTSLLFFRPTVCRGVTSLAANTCGCDDGRIGPLVAQGLTLEAYQTGGDHTAAPRAHRTASWHVLSHASLAIRALMCK